MGRRHEQRFLQKRHPHGQKTHENMFIITIREMQIKTTTSYHLTPVRMAKSKNIRKCIWNRFLKICIGIFHEETSFIMVKCDWN